ncbi:hypothetical protein BpHYR1_012994 [Brachionus plicatilis]|uniref:Uncharacterized protein n=1 Tax=Brachionus plicatilis TaxID=10195 RepID=A0A3M7PW85_BRAPC|nr:hypothetical protein BpHYR1_012994 [Brachionus plicatilis]
MLNEYNDNVHSILKISQNFNFQDLRPAELSTIRIPISNDSVGEEMVARSKLSQTFNLVSSFNRSNNSRSVGECMEPILRLDIDPIIKLLLEDIVPKFAEP